MCYKDLHVVALSPSQRVPKLPPCSKYKRDEFAATKLDIAKLKEAMAEGGGPEADACDGMDLGTDVTSDEHIK